MKTLFALVISSLLLSLTLLSHSLRAQTPQKEARGAFLQIGVTSTGYYGDLNVGEGSVFTAPYFSMSPGVELVLQPVQWGRIAPQIRAGYSQFVAENPDARNNPPQPVATEEGPVIPNTFAEVTLPYLSLLLEYRLLKPSKRLQPLVSAGLRIMSFSSKNKQGDALAQLWGTRLPEERTLPSLAPALSLGLGVEYMINNRLRLTFGYQHIRSGSDYLDNVGKLGTKEGNDKLHTLRLGLAFRLGR